jgi:hypothetical protein
VAGADLINEIAGFTVPVNLGDGAGRFNTFSVIGSAASGRFFHSNLETTIEGAIRFYSSLPFLQSLAFGSNCGTGNEVAGPVRSFLDNSLLPAGSEKRAQACLAALLDVEKDQPLGTATFQEAVDHIAGFLRVLDVWYEFQGCVRFLNEAIDNINFDPPVSGELAAQHCAFNLKDANKSLNGYKFKPNPFKDLEKALGGLQKSIVKAAKQNQDGALEGYWDDVMELQATLATLTP